MLKKSILAAAALAIGSAAFVPTQAIAQVGVSFVIGSAPPPLRYERMPPPRHGYVWAPGYWGWDGYRHVWMAGSWLPDRPGYVYAAPSWREREGRWYYEQARWNRHGGGDRDHDGVPNRYDRDRDGDGIPNRYDRNPNHYDRGRPVQHAYGPGPRRDQDRDGIPNRYDRDRDGDGVPNRRDDRPDNPHRR
ncbi:YXWGXW repeat-containing protein [Pseudoduganella lurida]|uniref:YXWGXW repeat-containing protein n=1 Tax=Pseudoduganella lurida TaxID=1036180 RepID=A0A562RKK1_9BURK|nr:YXWGXW repeat-containing protein [Pseudoduganella lurida]TWI69577.1 YXWGXW repeat-containing protein [Pseudoduganella lurida]